MSFPSSFPVIFVLFLIFIIVIQYRLRKHSRIEENHKNEFWKKEQESRMVRKKEIYDSDYIHPTIDKLNFPTEVCRDEESLNQLNYFKNRLLQLLELDMMNFSMLSNTEIRFRFGSVNEQIIATNEANFQAFIKTLAQYAEFIYNRGELSESQTALEIALDLGSDYSKHYIALAQIYIDNNLQEKLHSLLESARKLESTNQLILLHRLEKFLESQGYSDLI